MENIKSVYNKNKIKMMKHGMMILNYLIDHILLQTFEIK